MAVGRIDRWLLLLAMGAAFAVVQMSALPSSAKAVADCPNLSVRTGPSSALPDCRAYELVSPTDTNGRLLAGISGFGFEPADDLFPTELASPSQDSFVYLAYDGPLLSPGEPNGTFDLYQARRSPDGWQTLRRISPSGAQSVLNTPGGVSSDHSYAFTHAGTVSSGSRPPGTLAGDVGEDYVANPDGSFEPTGMGSLGIEPLAQGRYISAGGEHIIFSTGFSAAQSRWCRLAGALKCKILQLEPDAPPTGTGAVYDRSADGPTKVVSLLPGDQKASAGQEAFYQGASKDGSTVAFKIEGTLYVRVPDEGDGETLKAAEGNPTYAGLSADGRYLFYVAGGESGDIHRFDTADESDEQVNSTGDGQIVNISADGSHVYFISESQIEGQGTLGQPNLYVWSGGTPVYIATVAPSDLEQTSGPAGSEVPALTRWTSWAVAPLSGVERGPGADSSRTTPDGTVLIFESRAKLTAYDNSGHTEVYRYDAEEGGIPICVSCPPVEPAVADAHLQEANLLGAPMVIHNLSDDGKRVFFETADALVGRDTDGVNDIYEWQQEGVAPRVELISSGQSFEYPPLKQNPNLPMPNVLFSVTPSGSDVMFLSQDALVNGAGSGGVPAIYDARENGGFAEPPIPVDCSEEGCHPGAGSPFSVVAPRSEQAKGSGNVKPRNKHRCHRLRKKGRSRRGKHCTRKHSKQHRAHASASGLSQSVDGLAQGASVSAAPAAGGSSEGTVQASQRPSTLAAGEGEFGEFGIKGVSATLSPAAAAMHPDFATHFTLNYHFIEGFPVADARTQEVTISLPPGLLGNPNAVPRCTTGELDAFANCPAASQVGISRLIVEDLGPAIEPIYNLEPPHPDKEVARLGFLAGLYPVFVDIKVRTAGDYGVTATAHSTPGLTALLEAETILWANPADSSHDKQRLNAKEAINCYFPGYTGAPCEAENGERPSGIAPADRKAFMTNPSACQGGEVGFAVSSYQLPGQVLSADAPLTPITDCTGLPFAPSFEADPTSHEAGAATGLKTALKLPQHLGENERATATMREARVTLPAGMQIAAGAANWIGTCSDSQIGYHEEVDTDCPDNSKLGTATIRSPALSTPIEGMIYQRSPQPGHQFGLWLAADALGLHVKIPGELEPDKTTGRLTAVFRDLPQVPVEEIDLNVWGGPKAPLQNPDHCGTLTTDFSFAPHSDDPATGGQSTMQITEGCNQGFGPTLQAGVTEPTAGRFSPFVFDLFRPDGNQALRGFELHLPNGELAKIKGVPLCSDADATAGTCPAGSRIGSLQATTGPGPDPFTLPQAGRAQPQIYLSGSYQGAPFSIVSEVPAQAGPFDLGTLSVRSGLEVEPESGSAVVKADPLPQFFEGVGIAYRHLHAVIDRPEFSLNPTDCREMAVAADVTSTQGTVAHPQARFQVDGCKALKFKPKLSLKLKGGTKRASYPALTAVLKARRGDANIAFASVALPHSEFLAQEHIGTICTRKQFAADRCPKGSVYGKARAVTPLLDKPLSGPVYLRSSSHPLPDLVAKLGGQLEIDLVGRIDSVHGGIRTTFESVPDAPVSKFVLQMRGGKKGLLTNSTDVCRGGHRATALMKAQNGRVTNLRPRLVSSGCAKK